MKLLKENLINAFNFIKKKFLVSIFISFFRKIENIWIQRFFCIAKNYSENTIATVFYQKQPAFEICEFFWKLQNKKWKFHKQLAG